MLVRQDTIVVHISALCFDGPLNVDQGYITDQMTLYHKLYHTAILAPSGDLYFIPPCRPTQFVQCTYSTTVKSVKTHFSLASKKIAFNKVGSVVPVERAMGTAKVK